MSCVLAGVHRLNPLFKINVLVYLHSNVLVYLLFGIYVNCIVRLSQRGLSLNRRSNGELLRLPLGATAGKAVYLSSLSAPWLYLKGEHGFHTDVFYDTAIRRQRD